MTTNNNIDFTCTCWKYAELCGPAEDQYEKYAKFYAFFIPSKFLLCYLFTLVWGGGIDSKVL